MTEQDQFGLNASYVEILRAQWEEDALSVSPEWQAYFAAKGPVTTVQGAPVVQAPSPKAPPAPPALPVVSTLPKTPLTGVAKKISENMMESLSIPTAMSTRDIPVKVLEENRAVINESLEQDARPRCSFTHLIAFAIVKSLKQNMALNGGFLAEGGQLFKLAREDINLGLAVDLPARDGGRSLVVPNLKACQNMDFVTFFTSYNDLIDRARMGKLTAKDYEGTTVTLTNPGGMGTVSSSPRLMVTQGSIFATGRIGYPAQYEAAAPETLRALGIGKVMTVTSTYDHRVIQGAESGKFLAALHELLIGEHNFYEEVFASLKIPHQPFRLSADRAVVLGLEADAVHTERAMRVSQLIHAYRVRGYLLAHVDPLHLIAQSHPQLDLETYGLTIWDLDREFATLGVLEKKVAPLREILRALRRSYCRRTGVEYMYINDVDEMSFVQEAAERRQPQFSPETKKEILNKLIQAEEFEHFLHKRFLGHKRFSIEGAEAAIPMLHTLLAQAAKHNATDVMIGMAHRGRLNVLANIVGKPYAAIFAEFDDIDPKTFQGSGDVKYHKGAQGILRFDDKSIRVELASNPSHLEAVNPVLEGQVRAQQDLVGDKHRKKIIPVLLHGDAAFAGQGIAYETLQLSGLIGFRTGGTIHLVINNQIGYTTPPENGRTSPNCSDLARAIFVPVFRVNADDPEACVDAMHKAFEYRMRFGKDVVIDLVCYRRHGHNEGDEPSFTQPILYAAIQKHPSVAQIYSDLLIRRKDLAPEEVERLTKTHHDIFDKALSDVREKGQGAFGKEYVVFKPKEKREVENPKTAVDLATIKRITQRVTYDPKSINLHPRIKTQVLDRRRAMVFDGKPGIDFGMAEILAYGSLCLEGIPVRMSGQDCGRGTFAHRHAVLYDVDDGSPYVPLAHLEDTQEPGDQQSAQQQSAQQQSAQHPSKFRIYDSPLSEAAVLGFEYGYSVTHPQSLVIWEAQFGDFFNGAQIQIDQFIASSEEKWGQSSRVTMFLPHGYDGQGPEHSSGRIERFLQLCAQKNMRVAICSTSAQFFHLIRRQAKQPKKPLIIFTHKSLLRSEEAASKVSELTKGRFEIVIDDPRFEVGKKAKRVIFCTGKVYWDLEKARQDKEAKTNDVRIVRVEQLYPFPSDEVDAILAEHKTADIVWLQEEPKNCGAYRFVGPYFRELGKVIRYVGRASAASPATGSPSIHKEQQQAIVDAAFDLSTPKGENVEI